MFYQQDALMQLAESTVRVQRCSSNVHDSYYTLAVSCHCHYDSSLRECALVLSV
jgi:hypothetical protein